MLRCTVVLLAAAVAAAAFAEEAPALVHLRVWAAEVELDPESSDGLSEIEELGGSPVMSADEVDKFISRLFGAGRARLLGDVSTFALHGRESAVRCVCEVPLPTAKLVGGVHTRDVTFRPVGLTAKILPRLIVGGDLVEMDVDIEVSYTAGRGEWDAPVEATCRLNTSVAVPCGKAVLNGGAVSYETVDTGDDEPAVASRHARQVIIAVFADVVDFAE